MNVPSAFQPGMWRYLFRGTDKMLRGTLIAVFLAPVLPDVFVEWFGGHSSYTDGLLRFAALATLFIGLVLFLAARTVAQFRAARRRTWTLAGLEPVDVLVLPLGLSAQYIPASERANPTSIPEWLIDSVTPTRVLLVVDPGLDSTRFDDFCAGLRSDGIPWERVDLSTVHEPDIATEECTRLIPPVLAARVPAGGRCYLDTTGGTVPQSLAMIRVAALTGYECVYVSAKREGRQIVVGSERAHRFRPTELSGA